MKLHLNATLRAALIAAIATVGFTLPQAEAEQALTGISPTSLTGGNTGINWNENTGDLVSWKLTFDFKETRAIGAYALFGTNNNSTCAGDTLFTNANGGITLTAGGSSQSSADGLVTQGGTVAVTLSYVADYDDAGSSLNKGTYTLTVGGGEAITLNVTNDGNSVFHKGTGSASRFWTNGGKEQFSNFTLTQLDNHVVTTPTSTWQGTEDSHNWADSVWSTGTYQDGNKAVFDATAESNVVTISQATTASSVFVSGQEYTFEIEDGGSLTAAKANIADDAGLTVVGGGTATIASLSGAGDLTVGEAGTATVNGLNSYTGVLSVTDGGTLNLGSNVTLSELTVADGTATTTHNAGNGVVTNTLTIGSDGTFKVLGGHDAFGYNAGATKDIVMQGEEGHLATLSLEQTTGNSVTMTTNIAMHGYSAITSKAGTKGFNTYGCSITVDGVENSIAVIDLRRDVTIDVAAAGTLEIAKVTKNSDGTKIITKTGEGTLTFKGDSLMNGLNVNKGTVQFTAGTSTLDALNVASDGKLEISGSDTDVTVGGTANTLSSTIHVNAATLHLNGTYAIDGNIGDMTISYSGGQDSHNGFRTSSGKIVVYKAEADGTVEIGEGAQITRDGVDVKDQLENGVYTASEETDYTNFYVNTGTEKVSKAYSEHTPTAFTLAENTKLDVDQNVTATVAGSGATSVVDIATGWELAGTAQNVKLAGSGTYALTGGTASLGDGTTLGEEWMGVVSLSNLTKADGNSAWIGGLANENSWVEFSNFTGYDRAWASSFAPAVTANIILTDDGEHHAAWNLTAFASSTYTMVISGDVKGNGTFKTSGGTAAQSQALEFQGDISDWEGAFVADAPGMRRVAFTGETMTVNARIAREGAGALNLVVGNGSDQTDAVFHEVVSVTSVEVKANDSAMFLGQLTTSTVTNAGSVVFDALSGLTQAITNSGDVTFNANFEVSGFHVTAGEFGYYDTEGNFSVDGNGYAGTSDSYITIVNGGSVNADEITVTQDGTDYTMNNSGRALADDGDVQYDTFYVNTDTVSTSAIEADGQASKVEVAGGTLDVDQSTGLEITVTGEATVIGDALDVAEIGIANEATAYFGDKLEMSDDGVEFQAAEGESVSVYNGGETAAYDLTNQNLVVTAQSIVKTTGDDVTVSNILNVDEIVNVQDAKLTLDGLSDVMTVSKITIGSNSAVELLDNQTSEEITVTVTEELAAGGGTLLANLVMADDSALLVNGVEKALHVGSTLTMGSNIALDGTTLQALDDLAVDEFFWLIDAAEGRELVYEGPTGDDAWYDSVFSRVAADGDYKLKGDFNIVFDDNLDAFGLKKFSNTPEPTTGTLSLLALMALAARRRRKH